MTCESISCRVTGLLDKNRKQVINPNLYVFYQVIRYFPHKGTRSDGVLFRFLESYLGQLEGPLAVQVWHRFLQLAKDIISNIRDSRPQVFPVLRYEACRWSPCTTSPLSFRCVSTLADKITQTTALEDRRIRKDLQVGLTLFSADIWLTLSGLGNIWETSWGHSGVCQPDYGLELLDSTKYQRRPFVKRSGFPDAKRWVLGPSAGSIFLRLWQCLQKLG